MDRNDGSEIQNMRIENVNVKERNTSGFVVAEGTNRKSIGGDEQMSCFVDALIGGMAAGCKRVPHGEG